MKVKRKSAWLLHFTAAPPIRSPWQLDNSTVMLVGTSEATGVFDRQFRSTCDHMRARFEGVAVEVGLGCRVGPAEPLAVAVTKISTTVAAARTIVAIARTHVAPELGQLSAHLAAGGAIEGTAESLVQSAQVSDLHRSTGSCRLTDAHPPGRRPRFSTQSCSLRATKLQVRGSWGRSRPKADPSRVNVLARRWPSSSLPTPRA
jgi:hypothetical protein